MSSTDDPLISMVRSVHDTKVRHVRLSEFYQQIRDGEWERQVAETMRVYACELERHGGSRSREAHEKAKKATQKMKAQTLPAFMLCGRFSHRSNAGLIEHSGRLPADIDMLPGSLIEPVREVLENDENCECCFLSPSGYGFKGIFLVDANPLTHQQSFETIRRRLKAQSIPIDPSGKDLARLCFASYDPQLQFDL